MRAQRARSATLRDPVGCAGTTLEAARSMTTSSSISPRTRRRRGPYALLVALALVAQGRIGRAESSSSPAEALTWQAHEQQVELALALHLRMVFDEDPALQADVRAYGHLVLEEIRRDLDNPSSAIATA